MNLDDNKEEKAAIRSLERAFKKCSALGITFSVMDSDLLYVNERLMVECKKEQDKDSYKTYNGIYPACAYAQQTERRECPQVKTFGSMESCGGW